jgi:hypothetical protein
MVVMSRDDQRMRELANRVVAMAPEPPPFPEEEATLTTHVKPSRPRPLLAFVGAALLVLVGAAIPILLNSTNSQPPVGTTTPPPVNTTELPGTTQPSPTTEPGTGTTAPTPTTEPAPAAVTHQTAVFLLQDPENSLMGNPALVPFWTEVEGPQGISEELLRLQLLTDDAFTAPASFYNAIPGDVEFLSIGREEQAILLEVNEAFRAGAGGLLADMTMLNQIVYTATYSSDADLVRFFIDGQVITDFGSDGLDLTGGVTRETFRDSLNLVLVTHPIYIGDGLPQVEGLANVFEATVSLEIVDPDGDVVYQDFTTATCGTGCWGEYAFSLDTPALTPDNLVRVFWNSPEDGSRRDVVYVPFAEDAVWDLVDEG